MPKTTIRLIVDSPLLGRFDKAIQVDTGLVSAGEAEGTLQTESALSLLESELLGWMRRYVYRPSAIEVAIAEIGNRLSRSK